MNGQSNAGKRSLALKMRKETTLSHAKIAEKLNTSPQSVSRWLRGIPAGSDVRQVTSPHEVVKKPLSPRFKPPHLIPHPTSPHPVDRVSDEVKKTLDEATKVVKPKIKKVKAKKKKPIYTKAILEKIDPETEIKTLEAFDLKPEPEIKDETLDVEEKPKRKGGFGGWFLLIVLAIMIIVVVIGLINKRKDQFELSEQEQEQKPITPTNPDGKNGEIDFTQGGI